LDQGRAASEHVVFPIPKKQLERKGFDHARVCIGLAWCRMQAMQLFLITDPQAQLNVTRVKRLTITRAKRHTCHRVDQLECHHVGSHTTSALVGPAVGQHSNKSNTHPARATLSHTHCAAIPNQKPDLH